MFTASFESYRFTETVWSELTLQVKEPIVIKSDIHTGPY